MNRLNMPKILELSNLNAYYKQSHVLHEISFDIEQSEIVTILGANGAGKTTLLKAIMGLVKTQGIIRFKGNNIHDAETSEIVRQGVALVPEQRGIFQQLTIEENLLLGAITHHNKQAINDDLKKVSDFFPFLKHRLHDIAGNLSGGEQQMLAIARALMLKPTLMMLDEPSFGLAPKIINQIFSIIKDIHHETHIPILLVAQLAEKALKLTNRVIVLETGTIVLHGDTELIHNNAKLYQAYLGY